jgi:glucosyl-dolichyl phosphate glucuronosyltransferase
MDISVVLATYNRASSLRTTLKTFSELVYPSGLFWELLVVDNNSSDSTRAVIAEFAAQAPFPVRYVLEKTQGRAAALNAGINNGKGRIIAFTDDDVLLTRTWLTGLKEAFDNYECAAVAGRVIPLWNHCKPDWLEMEDQQAVVNFDLGDDFKEIEFAPLGANSAFRRDVFARFGLFRLDLGVRGEKHTITCDDTEFGGRLTAAGEKIVYSPNAIIYHPVDPLRTTKKYFLTWHYYNGVSLTRMEGLPNEGVSYFGVPRWHYRELAGNLLRWVFSVDSQQRFRYKLRSYRSIGTIAESRRLSRVRRANGYGSRLQGQDLTRYPQRD